MDKSELFQTFKLIVDKENEAHELYVELASKVLTPALKETLLKFSEDEKEHRDTIMKEYRKLKEELGL